MSTVANLRAARAAIAIQSKWCTGKLLNSQGQMCALGAVATVLSLPLGRDNDETYSRLAVTPEVLYLARAARRMRDDVRGYTDHPCSVIYGVNDNSWPFTPDLHPDVPYKTLTPAQCHARVLRMFDESIKDCLAESVLLP